MCGALQLNKLHIEIVYLKIRCVQIDKKNADSTTSVRTTKVIHIKTNCATQKQSNKRVSDINEAEMIACERYRSVLLYVLFFLLCFLFCLFLCFRRLLLAHFYSFSIRVNTFSSIALRQYTSRILLWNFYVFVCVYVYACVYFVFIFIFTFSCFNLRVDT